MNLNKELECIRKGYTLSEFEKIEKATMRLLEGYTQNRATIPSDDNGNYTLTETQLSALLIMALAYGERKKIRQAP